jgi:type 1 fimbria pilin
MFNVHILTLPLPSYNGATEIPLVKMPSGYGGITVLEAHLLGGAGTAVGGKLVTMADAGTPAINGTIGAFAGTVVGDSVSRAALTLSDAYVGAGEWIGYDQTSGTVAADAKISISYLMGKV